MALTSYTDTNKVTSVGLRTIYQVTRDTVSQDKPFFVYRRVRTKTYSYIGMDEATAKLCVAAKLSQYTRTYPTWEWKNHRWQRVTGVESTYTELVADVQPVHDEGALWRVDISVNEEAVVYSANRLADIPAAFAAASMDPWAYDE